MRDINTRMTTYSMKRLLLMTMLCCGLTATAQRASAQAEPGHFYIQPGFGGVYSFFSGSQTHYIYLGRFDSFNSTGSLYMDKDVNHGVGSSSDHL